MLKGLTNTIKNACNDIELTLSEYIVIGGKTIPIKAELNDYCYDNGNFVGTFILKELKFEASNEISYRNKEFEYYKRINGESIKIGTFITTEINNSDSEEVTKVVAMDYGLKTQVEYKSNLDYSSGNITLLDVWNECCELSGLESGVTEFTNSDFIVTDDQFTGTGATIRDVFIGIGLSSGSFIKVMNDDKIYPIFNEYDSNIKSGNNITLENDINNNHVDIQIDGKSVQDGTPTPESPVEIKTVKGIRNLFDKDNANMLNCYVNNNGVLSSETTRSIYIPIIGGKTYTITRNGSKRLRAITTDVLPSNGVSKIDIINNDKASSITISTSTNSKYLVVYFYLTSDENDKTIEETMATIQIEEGLISHDYVPYGYWLQVKTTSGEQEQSTLIDMNKYDEDGNIIGYYELSSIGDTKDVLTIQKGKANINQKIDKISSYNGEAITTNYISTTGELTTGATVHYELAEPQTITLNGTYDIKLFDGINNITTNDDLQPNMEIEYSVINEIVEEYTELEDKRDTQPITCLRLGLSQIEGENVDIQDEDLIKKYGEHWLIINDNPFAYTQAKRVELINAIFDKVKGFGYSAFVSKTSFKPYLTCGDVIKFKNKAGELVKSIVLRYNHNFDEITLEAPSETSATVKYVYPTKDIDLIKRTEIIVDKNTNQITSLTQQTTTIQNDLQQNYYDKTQTNQLIQTSGEGITNTFSEAGGNNIFRNTGLWFEDSSTSYYIYPKNDLYPSNQTFTNCQRVYEYWDGLVNKVYYDKAANLIALSLQKGYLEQKQQVPNGNYTVSFKYKKLVETADTYVLINDVKYNLDSLEDKEFKTGEQDSNGNYITQPLVVSNGYIYIRFYSGVDNAIQIYDLMVNAGSVKLAYSQNQNETTTDTVNISKGITITSSNIDTTFKANADGIRTLNKNNETLSEFTDKGMKNKQMEVTDEATIVKVLWQAVGEQTWLTRL